MTNICFCGHDCARCVTYLATVRDDPDMRLRAQNFYRETFSLDIPVQAVCCLGGRSERVMELCRDCPWMRCCRERGLDACGECPDFPCVPLAEYREKYVNRCNQLEEDET